MSTENNALEATTETLTGLGIASWSALAYFILGLITLALALTAVPPAGLAYPYLDTLKQYPKDYFWQYLSLFMLLAYAVFTVSLASVIKRRHRATALVGLVFSTMSCLILIVTYYVQVTVVPISLMSQEKDGLALLTQYNPHGTFIALEELAYLLMAIGSIPLFFLFPGKGWKERTVRIVVVVEGAGVLASSLVIAFLYGLDKKDRFEIAVILIVWTANLVNSLLVRGLLVQKRKEIAGGGQGAPGDHHPSNAPQSSRRPT